MTKENISLYLPPEVQVIETHLQSVICTSGEKGLGFGENPGYQYDNW